MKFRNIQGLNKKETDRRDPKIFLMEDLNDLTSLQKTEVALWEKFNS